MNNLSNDQIPVQTFGNIEKLRTILKRSDVSYDDTLEAEKALGSILEETNALVKFANQAREQTRSFSNTQNPIPEPKPREQETDEPKDEE